MFRPKFVCTFIYHSYFYVFYRYSFCSSISIFLILLYLIPRFFFIITISIHRYSNFKRNAVFNKSFWRMFISMENYMRNESKRLFRNTKKSINTSMLALSSWETCMQTTWRDWEICSELELEALGLEFGLSRVDFPLWVRKHRVWANFYYCSCLSPNLFFSFF